MIYQSAAGIAAMDTKRRTCRVSRMQRLRVETSHLPVFFLSDASEPAEKLRMRFQSPSVWCLLCDRLMGTTV